MSGKSKSLTKNGVLSLFNQEIKTAINMQVIFIASTDVSCYLRLSDGKHVSPVIILLNENYNPKFRVGAILAIKEVCFMLLEERTEGQHPLEDKGFHPLYIKSYSLLEHHHVTKSILGSLDPFTSYVDAINHVHQILRNLDPKIGEHIRGSKQLQEEAESLRCRGNTCFNQQEYNEAIALYDTAKKKDPFDYRVWSNCSQAHFKMEEYEEAEKDAVIAIKMNPFIEKVYYRAAQAALYLRDSTPAVVYAESGIFICGKSKDLQQIIDGMPKLNTEETQEKIEAIITNSLERVPALLTAVTRSANISSAASNFLIEKAVAFTKNTISTQVEETLENLKEFTLGDEDQTKEQKKEAKGKKEKNKRKIKAVIEENLKECEEKRIKEEKRKEKEEERKKLESKKEKNLKPINAFHETLRDGRRLYETGQLHQAIEMFSRSLACCCLDSDGNINKCGNSERLEVQVIQFVIGLCRIQSGRVYILDGMEIMKSLSDAKSAFPNRPAAHYWLGLGYEKIYLFKKAHYHACTCAEGLMSQKNIKPLKWPGTDDPIPETVPETLQDNARELVGRAASSRQTPKARCRFKDCIATQAHAYAKEEIYVTDPDFKGFLDVTCEEYCTVSYHPCCWKAHKEQLDEGIGRMSDKDFLGMECITPDCTGKICSIRIYDETSKLKNELAKDKKEKKNGLPISKQKKKEKKEKKIQTSRLAEAREKKKCKSESFSEDAPCGDEAFSKAELTADHSKTGTNDGANINKEKSSAPAASNLPIDPESLQTTQITILKPVLDEEESIFIRPGKKNKKKNKKNKASAQPDLLGDPLEVPQSVQNEYLSRLRVLRHQREALEGDLTSLPKATSPVIPGVTPSENPLKLLDPENPFYMPQHLRDNPQELECILQTSMMQTTSPNLQQETINTLLDFMYDWLKSEGPMSINDARLREQVSESFPLEASTYVNQCGGIKEFLMQSIKFAMIDDVICVGDHVVNAQELVCSEIKDRMINSRYLTKYSDGRKAKKFTHLLEDTKSTCSSASSTSQLAGSGVSYVSKGTSDSTLSANKIFYGEANKTATKASVRISPVSFLTNNSIQELGECTIPDMSLNPSAPEFEPVFNELSDEEDNAWETEFECNSNRWAMHRDEKFDKDYSDLDHKDKEDCDLAMKSEKSIIAVEETDEISQCDEDDDDDEDEECGDDLEESDQNENLMVEVEDLKEDLQREREQNQHLNDKLFQVKSHFKSEVNKLKQQLGDLREANVELEAEKQSLVAQRESESRKFKSDMSRMQDEVKTFQSKNQSLELKYERCNDKFNELQGKLVEEQEVNMQIREEMKNLQESLTSSSQRAHEAEVKYMCIKKDLVEDHLNRTIERLSDEVRQLRRLLPSASEETIPDRATLTRSIVTWDETIKSLRDHRRTFTEEGKKLLGMVNQGRPLNALPPGDLSIPPIPSISVAPLLSLGQKTSRKSSPLIAPENNQELAKHPSSSPQTPLLPLTVPVSVDPPPSVGIPLIYQSSALEGNPVFMRNGGTAVPFNCGAIPKGIINQPSTTAEIPSSTKWGDAPSLLMGTHTWEYSDGDVKPLIVGTHALGVQAKESKNPSKPTSLTVGGVSVSITDSVGSNSSAYGLSDISLNASAEVNMSSAHTQSTPTLHQPTTLTVTKPKFQNLSSNSSVGTIGAPPPKLVRPQSRQSQNTVKMGNQGSVVKDDSVTITTSYKKLIEICKQRIGKDHTSPEICSALREVRNQNNNSLSGMSTEKIVERVKLQLRSRHAGCGQATVAPWAGLTQGPGASPGPEWKGPVNEEGMKAEESCSICLEALSASSTVPLQCQHVFHEKCIKDWLKRQSNCPNCRTFALMTDEYPSLTHS
ncbi:E3 ubiquitin-protein ligase TTC3 isoform X5 [Cherax quadricarinatus]